MSPPTASASTTPARRTGARLPVRRLASSSLAQQQRDISDSRASSQRDHATDAPRQVVPPCCAPSSSSSSPKGTSATAAAAAAAAAARLTTGIASLDDILVGPEAGGLESGAVLLLVPALGLAQLASTEIGGGGSRHARAASGTDGASSRSSKTQLPAEVVERGRRERRQLRPADETCRTVLSYGVAHALHLGQRCLVVGESANPLAEGAPSAVRSVDGDEVRRGAGIRVDGRRGVTSSSTSAAAAAAATAPEKESLGSAARYASMPLLTPLAASETDGVVPTDLSKPVGADAVREACARWSDLSSSSSSSSSSASSSSSGSVSRGAPRRNDGLARMRVVDLGSDKDAGRGGDGLRGETGIEVAWREIEAAVRLAERDAAESTRPTALRIVLAGVGSRAWLRGVPARHRAQALCALLLRLRHLLRRFAASHPQCGVTASLSLDARLWRSPSSSYSPTTVAAPATPPPLALVLRLARLADACATVSSFLGATCPPALRDAYASYAGAIRVVRAPAPCGHVLPGSESSSALRGLGAGVGGGGGGENDLGYRMARRGLRFDTLHLDVDAGAGAGGAGGGGGGGVSERRTRPVEASSGEALGAKFASASRLARARARPATTAAAASRSVGGLGGDIEEAASRLPRRRGGVGVGANGDDDGEADAVKGADDELGVASAGPRREKGGKDDDDDEAAAAAAALRELALRSGLDAEAAQRATRGVGGGGGDGGGRRLVSALKGARHVDAKREVRKSDAANVGVSFSGGADAE